MSSVSPAGPAKEYLSTRDRIRVVGFFPGLGSRSAYKNLGRGLLDSGIPAVTRIYQQAATALGFPGHTSRLLFTPENLPQSDVERQGFLGAALVVHSLAINAQLQNIAEKNGLPVSITAYTGESFGILTAAIASGSLSVPDGVLVAQAFTPLMLLAATGHVPNDTFANDLATYLPGAVRGTKLVPEPFHVVAVKAPSENVLADALVEIREQFIEDDVELHKAYSPRQANLYVHPGVKDEFDRALRTISAVQTYELKEPTVFLAHSRKMLPGREALERFLDANWVRFSDPTVPVVANHSGRLLSTGREVRDAVLAMCDEVMASQSTAEALNDLDVDMVLELGLGGKSLQLLADNHLVAPAGAYTGAPGEVERFIRLVDLTDQFMTQLEKLYASDQCLETWHYDILRKLFQLVDECSLSEKYVRRLMGRNIAGEMLQSDPAGSEAFYQLLETFQHTFAHRGHIDAGELVLRARLKKRLAGNPGTVGRPYAELKVLRPDGTTGTRTLTTDEHEVVVFHFDGLDGANDQDLARSVRRLQEVGSVSSRDHDGLAHVNSRIVYPYLLFEALRRHRPAVFAHDFYLEGSDPLGWTVALVAAGSLDLADAVHAFPAAHSCDVDRLLALVRPAEIPVIAPQGGPVQAEDDLREATRSVFRDHALNGRARRLRLNGSCRVISVGADWAADRADTGAFPARVTPVTSPASVRSRGVNTDLDAFEFRSLMSLTRENVRVRENAQYRRILPSTVNAYTNIDEQIVAFGKGGSESMTMFLKKDGEDRITVRKVLSEALTTARWKPDGTGVMLPPFAKARKQAEFLEALPAPARSFFPEVYGVTERRVPVLAHLPDASGSGTAKEVIYEMGYIGGEEVSRFVEKQVPPPAVVARLYEQIVRILNEQVHSVHRVPAPGETLEVSYFKKIEDRLELCRRTAPATFDENLLDTEHIVINGLPYLNHRPLLRRFRQAPEFLAVLEPAFHSLVMGDTNTENVKILDVRPLLHAQHVIENGAPEAEVEKALAAVTPESLGIMFLDPRAIGFKGAGADTRDDAMYDNKPWHNSIGHYDEMHFEHFAMRVEAGEGRTPSVDIEFEPGNPYQRAYRVRDVTPNGDRVNTADPQGMEDYFAPVMTRALGLDDPQSAFLRDDPYWLIRFVFMMGQHFTAMPPFHFQSELDGTLPDSYLTQRRPVAIYCEGIKWLNWALEMLEGKRTEFLGLEVPPLPYR